MIETQEPGAGRAPLVSVIIASFNYGRFVGQALDSVLSQTYPHWECVVVDDGSTDHTPEVVARYAARDARIRYLRQENAGPAAARNNGLRNSGGQYVQFLDADDLLRPGKFEEQVGYLEQHPEVDIVYSGGRYFEPCAAGACDFEAGGESFSVRWEADPWQADFPDGTETALPALVRSCPMNPSIPLIRRSVFDDAGCFDERLRYCEEWDFWIRCAALGKSFRRVESGESLVFIRSHPSSLTKDTRRMDEGISRFRRKLSRTLSDPELVRLNRRLAASHEGYSGVREVQRGNRARGAWRCLKAGALSESAREALKWCFCAAVAPFAPAGRFEQVAARPVGESLTSLLRPRGTP